MVAKSISHELGHQLNNPNLKNRTCVSLTCEVCGKTFLREKRKISSNYQKHFYCSYKCFGTKTVPCVTSTCSQCGKTIIKKPYLLAKANRHFCSRVCRYTFFTGRNSPRWKDEYLTVPETGRDRARRYFPNQCMVCGWNEATCDAHHIKPSKISHNHELENLIILCPNHHRLANIGKLSINELEEFRARYYPIVKISVNL